MSSPILSIITRKRAQYTAILDLFKCFLSGKNLEYYYCSGHNASGGPKGEKLDMTPPPRNSQSYYPLCAILCLEYLILEKFPS